MPRIACCSLLALIAMGLGACQDAPSPEPKPEAAPAEPPPERVTEHPDPEDEAIPEALRQALIAARAQAQTGDGGPKTLSFEFDDAGKEAMRSFTEGRTADQRARWLGAMFPQVELVDLEGRSISLAGERTVVNFWATWCAPCIKELPLFAALDQTENGVRVVTVSNDFALAQLQAFLAATPTGLPVVFDEGRALAKAVDVFSWPTSFVLDSEGRIENIFGMVPDLDALNREVGVD